VATLYRITIIILHYLVEASLNESDIMVALANTASFNGNHARASCPGAVGAFSFTSSAAITRPLSTGSISFGDVP
jgi:hypothetical protein